MATYGDDPQTTAEPGQTLICIDCKAPFVFSEGEMRFFQSKSLMIPKRCKACRVLKKAQRLMPQ